MKVALIHDFLNQYGGAEKVLEAFLEIWPKAPVFTLIYDEKAMKTRFSNFDIRPSPIQNLPFGVKKYRWYLPLMPSAIERFDLSNYDLVISDSSAYAKGVLTSPKTIHISYIHTPTRYLWSEANTYLEGVGEGFGLIRKLISPFLTYLRTWDFVAAQRPDYLIANSNFVAERIKKYYRRKPEAIIYPPVETEKFFVAPPVAEAAGCVAKKTVAQAERPWCPPKPWRRRTSEAERERKFLGGKFDSVFSGDQPRAEANYFLVISRFRPYKKVDLAIETFNKLKLPLKIIGTGEGETLYKTAGPTIEFLGEVSDEKKAEVLAGAQALIHPQEEDFGITACEAMASGLPVIAYKAGGALETIIENETGLFFENQNWQSLANAVLKFKKENFNSEKIRQYSQKFSKERFKAEILEFVNRVIKSSQQPEHIRTPQTSPKNGNQLS